MSADKGKWLRPPYGEKFHFVPEIDILTLSTKTLCRRDIDAAECKEGMPSKAEKCGTCYAYQLQLRQSWLDSQTISELHRNRQSTRSRRSAC